MLSLQKNPGYLISIIIGAIFGSIFYIIQPVTWRAETIISIGYLGGYEQGQGQGQETQLESLPVTVERLKSKDFIRSIASDVGENSTLQSSISLTIRPLKDNLSLIVSVDTNNRNDSEKIIRRAVAELIRHHSIIFNIRKLYLDKRLKAYKNYESFLDKQKAEALNRIGSRYDNFSKIWFVDRELKILEIKIQDLEDAISKSENTREIGSLSIFERRLIPSLPLASLIGALLGFSLFFFSKNRIA